MTTLPIAQYRKALRQSGLVTNEQEAVLLKEFQAEAPADRKEDAGAYADWLLAKGTITSWQNGKLSQGMYKGFFLGKYKLLKHVGSGGMSSVYLGEHVLMRRCAAIKILPKARVDDSSYLERFFLEARAIAALDHPNIVRAYNLNNEGNLYYIVMEFVQGEDLERRVIKNGPLPYEDALDYIRQAADGLQHAHERRMIHRDIKPSNLLLDETGTVKILDMGLAKLTADDRSLTREHNERVLGTTDYLAPEQAIDSSSVDARADIYSLGCTLYFLVTGRPPFPEGTLAQRLMKHQVEEPKPIEETRPDCPAELIEICRLLMAKRREERYQTAQDVSDACAEVLLNLYGRSVKRTVSRPAAPASDATVELRADDTHFGKKRGSGSGPVVAQESRGGAAVKSGSSTQRAPAAVAPAVAAPATGSTVKTASAEATEVDAAPLWMEQVDASPSVRSAPAVRSAEQPIYTKPWAIGAAILGVVAVAGIGAFVFSGKPGQRGGGGGTKHPVASSGKVTIPFQGFPIGVDYQMTFRPAKAGAYQLVLNVERALPGTTAKVRLGDSVVGEKLEVSKTGPDGANFNLGRHTLNDGDNRLQVTLSKPNEFKDFKFSLVYQSVD